MKSDVRFLGICIVLAAVVVSGAVVLAHRYSFDGSVRRDTLTGRVEILRDGHWASVQASPKD